MDYLSARNNMVDSQVRTNDVTLGDLQRAMRTVAREKFCAPARDYAAYAEAEIEVAPGRWLMKPRDVAKLLQAAHARPGERVLAIAAPYAAAILSEVGADVTALEPDGRAAAVVEQGLRDYGAEPLVGDAKVPPAGFDLIVSEGAVAEVPDSWIAALNPGGRLAVVVRDGPVGKARLYIRGEGYASSRELFDATPPVLAGFEKAPTFQF